MKKQEISNLATIMFHFAVKTCELVTNGEKRTGLRLVLCRDLAKKCRSELKVYSNCDKDTRFSFTLPII